MKKILTQIMDNGNKGFYLVDTDTATLIHEENGDRNYCRLYKTKKKRYFKVFKDGQATLLTEEQAKEYLASKEDCIDEYISVFGSVAEW